MSGTSVTGMVILGSGHICCCTFHLLFNLCVFLVVYVILGHLTTDLFCCVHMRTCWSFLPIWWHPHVDSSFFQPETSPHLHLFSFLLINLDNWQRCSPSSTDIWHLTEKSRGQKERGGVSPVRDVIGPAYCLCRKWTNGQLNPLYGLVVNKTKKKLLNSII